MSDRMSYRPSIFVQPQSLETSRHAVAEALDGIDLAPLRGAALGLVGIGASLQAAVTAAAAMRGRGMRAQAFCPTDLYDAAVDGADAFLALSASGRSRETARAMELRPRAPRYGVSKVAGAPLSAVTQATIVTRSGVDGGPNTTSYTATLQACGLLADRITGRASADWAALPGLVERTLEAIGEPVRRAAAALAGRTAIDLVGAEAVLGSAGETALLIREAARVPANGWDTLNFLHGPMESLDGRTGLVVFGDGREVRLAQDVAALGCPTVLVTTRGDVADAAGLTVIRVPATGDMLADAILAILPGQLLTAELSDAAGLKDTAFRYRQTDTKFPLQAA